MAVGGTFAPEGENDMRLKRTHAPRQLAAELVQSRELQLAVPIGEKLMVMNAQNGAGIRELLAADGAEFFAALRRAAICGGLTIGQAKDMGFDATVGGKRQRTAKGEALVIRMGYDTKQAKAHAASSVPRAHSSRVRMPVAD